MSRPPGPALVVSPQDCVVYFIVPCMNEELVIGDTVRSLLADSRGPWSWWSTMPPTTGPASWPRRSTPTG